MVRGGFASSQSWSACPPPTCIGLKLIFVSSARFLKLSGALGFSTTRTQTAPHVAQHPFSLVPALIQGMTRLGGKVAKCASGYGDVGIVQTERRLRPGFLAKFSNAF